MANNQHADFTAALDKVNAGNATEQDVANLKARSNDTNLTEAERQAAKTALENANSTANNISNGDTNDRTTQRTR